MVRYGRQGKARYGSVGSGAVEYGRRGQVRRGWIWRGDVRCGMAGEARYGLMRSVASRFGKVR